LPAASPRLQAPYENRAAHREEGGFVGVRVSAEVGGGGGVSRRSSCVTTREEEAQAAREEEEEDEGGAVKEKEANVSVAHLMCSVADAQQEVQCLVEKAHSTQQ
jgi:hypothetical protein